MDAENDVAADPEFLWAVVLNLGRRLAEQDAKVAHLTAQRDTLRAALTDLHIHVTDAVAAALAQTATTEPK